ncbi:MAG TPA: hypothetical protein VJH65_02855 [Candidatus Nanoarchaeia archaeon]|nr:hypothetical protein [Candidatus Nanoarchaeia archaeon]
MGFFTEGQLKALIDNLGPFNAFEKAIHCNNSRILDGSLSGFEIVHERSLIYDIFIKRWFDNLQNEFFSKKEKNSKFALLAVGGYGRREMNPNSDVDLKLIVNNLEGITEEFAEAYKESIIYGAEQKYFLDSHSALVHQISDLQSFTEKELNQFLDMRFLAGSRDFADEINETFKKNYNSLELFLHNVAFLEEVQQKYPHSIDNIEVCNLKKGVGCLRNFQVAMWMEASEHFIPITQIYHSREVPEEVLGSYEFLLQLRSWLNLNKQKKRGDFGFTQQKKETDHINDDLLKRDDFAALNEDVRERLLFARRKIYQFAQSKMYEKLNKGVFLGNEILYGFQGLYFKEKTTNETAEERNKKLFSLLLISQRRGLQINPAEYLSTLKSVHEWIEPNSIFVELLKEKGSFYNTVQKLFELNALEKLLPGYSKLESSINDVQCRASNLTEGGFARQKIATLEKLISEESPTSSFAKEYSLLSQDYTAAIKLALLIKRIPYIDEEMKGVYSIDLKNYIKRLGDMYSFPQEILEMAYFLVRNHSLLIDIGKSRLNDHATVTDLVEKCRDVNYLRSLFLFTHADYGFVEKKDEPHLWQNIEELKTKATNRILGRREELPYDPLALDEEGQSIAEDLGSDFRSGRYANQIMTWVPLLQKVDSNKKPIVRAYYMNNADIMNIISVDYPGLLAVIAGIFCEEDVNIRQAHAYSLSGHNLALDFFDFVPPKKSIKELMNKLESAIANKTFIYRNPEEILRSLSKDVSLEHLQRQGYYKLCFKCEQNRPGILYALTRVLHDKIEANIYSLSAYSPQNKRIEDYLFFNANRNRSFKEIEKLVREHIG